MSQQGQIFRMKRTGRDGEPLWAYLSRSLTLAELVEIYLAQHDVEPVTIAKLRWLLAKAVAAFGDRSVADIRSEEIAAWRIALSPGYRFDATQALRQVLARAVVLGMIDVNPAKLGVDNPSPRRREQRPFESWAELDAVAANLSPRYRPMVIFGAATGLRPAEWLALEWRDIDLQAAWTPNLAATVIRDNGASSEAGRNSKPSDGLEPSTPSLPSMRVRACRRWPHVVASCRAVRPWCDPDRSDPLPVSRFQPSLSEVWERGAGLSRIRSIRSVVPWRGGISGASRCTAVLIKEVRRPRTTREDTRFVRSRAIEAAPSPIWWNDHSLNLTGSSRFCCSGTGNE
jgi:integrase